MSNYEFYFDTAVGTIHAQVTPTMEALGDQPWLVRLRGTNGELLLSCAVEDMSAMGAAADAVRTFLDCKKDVCNKSFCNKSFQ